MGWAILIIFGVIALDYIIFKKILPKKRPQARRPPWRWNVYIIVLVIFFYNWGHLLFSEQIRPSPVDASPIALLTQEQMEIGHIRAVLDSFQENENIGGFETDPFPRQRNWSRTYRFSFVHESRGVSVRIQFYRDEQHLTDHLPFRTTRASRRGSVVINNENNTQAFLHATFIPRSHGAPVSYRVISTELRIGSVHIDMTEHRDSRNAFPDAASYFIRFLYEQLTADQ